MVKGLESDIVKETNIPIVSGILKSRKEIIELIAITILIAFSINTISNIIVNSKAISPIYFIIISFMILVISVIYVSSKFIKKTHKQTYEAFFVYDYKSQRIIPVFRYWFGERIAEYFQALFYENPALKAIWEVECPIEGKESTDKRHEFSSTQYN